MHVICGLVGLLALTPKLATAMDVSGRFGEWSVGGYVEGYAVQSIEPRSPRQRPAGILLLRFQGSVRPDLQLFFSSKGIVGGTPENASGLGIYNFRDTFQNISPAVQIDEAYLAFSRGKVDIHAGMQKLAWGKLDRFQPTDVINPRQYNDPFVAEEEDAKISVPAFRLSYYPPGLPPIRLTDSSLSLVWIPVPVSPRFPLPRERWFPAATALPPTLRIPRDSIAAGFPTVVVRNALRTQNRPLAQQLDEGAIGVRLAGLLGTVEWALVYYDGAETALNFDLRTTIDAPLVRRTLRVGGIPTINDLRLLDSDSILGQRAGRMRLVGGDTAFEFGDATARIEAAYGYDRFLPRSTRGLISLANLKHSIAPTLDRTVARLLSGKRARVSLGTLFVQRDTVEWGMGLDYRYKGWMPLAQVNQTLVFDNPTELLVNDVDTRLVLTLRRTFFRDRMEAEVVSIHGIERGYDVGLTRWTYSLTDTIRVRLGFLLVAGSRRTIIGQFHDNDELFLQVRYSF